MIAELDTIYGRMFVPDTDNGQYWWLKTMGASPEFEMIEYVCEMLDQMPRGIAIDAGANFGCWSLPLARHADYVIAVEPQRCVLSALKQTLDANPDLDIALLECALGAEPGTANFPDISLENSTNFGGVAINVPHAEHPNAPMYEVLVATIDYIMQRWEDRRVSFIKLDIEGSELNALRGAQRTIWRWKPIMIVEADHASTDTQALGNFIQSMKYNVEIFRDNNFICMPV